MASPTLESFCCTPNDSFSHHHQDLPSFRTVTYNIVCMVSSSLSILGVIYQLLPRTKSTRRTPKSTYHKRIIKWLAFADLLASLGILVRSVVWLSGKIPQYDPLTGSAADFSHIFCAVISAWVQYFYLCTYFWTLCYALDIYLFIFDKSDGKQWLYRLYHAICWGVSAILCASGLIVLYEPNLLREARLPMSRTPRACLWTDFFPCGHDPPRSCEHKQSTTIPHYLFTYVPILLIMIVNPLLYIRASQRLKKKLSGQIGRFTDHERNFMSAVKTKFLLVVIVFYLCWGPNIINGIMLWNYRKVKHGAFIGLWTFMAVINPLQAFLNSLVYRGLAGCNFRFPHSLSARSGPTTAPVRKLREPREDTALLQNSFSELAT